MLAIVKGKEPSDQIEAMLPAQMAAVHKASMTFVRPPRRECPASAERAFNKLTRTFAAQVSTLKDYRSKGEQKMTVQHVHVADAKQAIVGNQRLWRGGRPAQKLENNPMHLDMDRALRCSARSKRSGMPCQAPAVRGAEVCRMRGRRGSEVQ
jgi:hypothetical protein